MTGRGVDEIPHDLENHLLLLFNVCFSVIHYSSDDDNGMMAMCKLLPLDDFVIFFLVVMKYHRNESTAAFNSNDNKGGRIGERLAGLLIKPSIAWGEVCNVATHGSKVPVCLDSSSEPPWP